MQMTLYKSTSDNNVVNKAITQLSNVNVYLKDNTSIINPVLTLDGININNLADANYCYLPQFQRYYFINDITLLRGNMYQLSLHVDVLMSYKTDILNLVGTVTRNENLKNGYIIDSDYQALSYSNIVTKTFPSGMTEDSFILMTVG